MLKIQTYILKCNDTQSLGHKTSSRPFDALFCSYTTKMTDLQIVNQLSKVIKL